MIIRNTDPFEYYRIQQLFNNVKVPRWHTENLSFENIFSPFKYSLLLFSWFYVLGYKYKGHDILRAGAFAPFAPPSTTRLVWCQVFLQRVFLNLLIKYFSVEQEQSPGDFLYKWCLKYLAKFIRKHIFRSLSFQLCCKNKKRLRHRWFQCEFSNIFKNTYFTYLSKRVSVSQFSKILWTFQKRRIFKLKDPS